MTDEQRETLLDGWEQVARGWERQSERWAETVSPVTGAMLAAAGLATGVRVLELAAGPGDLSRRAAALVAPTNVLCTDGVEAMVEVARELAEDEAVPNLVFRQAQLESIDLPAASVDVILCRYGLMLAVDPAAALRECRRVLAPGGKLVAAVQGPPALNPWITGPVEAAITVGAMQRTTPSGPGPFALADSTRLLDLLGDGGFFDTTIEEVDFRWHYVNPNDWLGEKVDHSNGFATVWREQDDARRGEIRAALAELAAPYAQADGSLVVPGRSLVAAAEV